MKHKISVLIILTILTFLDGRAIDKPDYQVHSITGCVSCRNGSEWKPLKKHDELSHDPKVNINQASSMKIIDKKSRMVFTFSYPGEYNLQDLIRRAQKENSSLTSKICAEAKKHTAAESTRTHKTIGASKRDPMDEEKLEALYTALVDGFTSGMNKGALRIFKHPVDNEIFILELLNESLLEPLYVNVFVKTKDSTWHALLPSTEEQCALMLAPGECIRLEHLPLCNEDDLILAAIGSKEDFDGDELTYMFEENMEPTEERLDNLNISFLR
ncbi:MAG: hypothetical protein K2M13_05795 [Muribaculaceae bacterium]|nr:hypothetical protein [Muribaculaceae bacterium]MDE6537530.1 hypothetical protein [Muribaculaceae bacterium]